MDKTFIDESVPTDSASDVSDETIDLSVKSLWEQLLKRYNEYIAFIYYHRGTVFSFATQDKPLTRKDKTEVERSIQGQRLDKVASIELALQKYISAVILDRKETHAELSPNFLADFAEQITSEKDKATPEVKKALEEILTKIHSVLAEYDIDVNRDKRYRLKFLLDLFEGKEFEYRGEIEQHQIDLKELDRINTKLIKDNNKTYENQINSIKSELSELKVDLENSKEHITQLKTEITNLEGQIVILTTEESDTTDQVQGRINSLEKDKLNLQTEIDYQIQFREQKAEEYTNLEVERDNLIKKLATNQIDKQILTDLQKSHLEVVTKNNNLDIEISSLNNQLSNIKNNLKTKEQQWETTYQSAIQQNTTLQGENEQLLLSIGTLSEDLTNSREGAIFLKSELDKNKQNLEELARKVTEENNGIFNTNSSLASELTEALKTSTSVQVENFQSKITLLTQQLNTERNKEQANAKIISLLRSQVNSLEKGSSVVSTRTPFNQFPNMDLYQNNPSGFAPLLTRKMGELFSRESKKEIPTYRGQDDIIDIVDWLKGAERVADNNEWDSEQRIRFFSDRLKDEAFDWHIEYMQQQKTIGNKPDYETWKLAIIGRFQDASDVERNRVKLNELRQLPGQRMKTFIAKLNKLYDLVNGREVVVDPTKFGVNDQNSPLTELMQANKKLRDEEKRKLLFRGLLLKYKDDIWARLPKNFSYDDVCEAAFTVETITSSKESGEEKGINAVLAGITMHDKNQDTIIANQTKEIAELTSKVNNMLTVQVEREQIPLVGAVGHSWSETSGQGIFRPDHSAEQGERKLQNSFDRNNTTPIRTTTYYPSQNRYPSRERNPSRDNSRERFPNRERFPSQERNFVTGSRSNSFSRDQARPEQQRNYSNSMQERPRRFNGQLNTTRPRPLFRPITSTEHREGMNEASRLAKQSISCYNCGKLGHYQKECWSAPRNPQVTFQEAKRGRRSQRP